MRRRGAYVAFALVAAFAISGCGDDNNDNNGNGGGTPTRTVTPTTAITPPTKTPTPTETPTASGSVSVSVTPTATPSTAVCEGAALIATTTSLGDSDLDTGFTGIAHDSVATEEAQVKVNMDCPDLVNCTINDPSLIGTNFGSPLPLSSGGVPTCIINQFREAVTGTYNCADGSSASAVKLKSSVFLVQDIAKPCPLCVGDPTPNDGVKGGTCESGKTPGAACEVGGISPTFGPTSNDCLPTGSSVGELDIDLDPLTTGSVSRSAGTNCLSTASPPGSCYCEKQVQPNSCLDGVCPASNQCENGPIDGLCSNQQFRSCRSGTGTEDCEEIFPGSGNCIDKPRPCFGTTISRQGTPGTQQGVLASIFCIPATRAAAINTTAGLAGPGALTLPTRIVRTVR